MSCCKDTRVYFDFRKKRNDSFRCHEEPLEGSQLCIFHDDKYHISNATEVLEKILEKVERAAKTMKSCIVLAIIFPGRVLSLEPAIQQISMVQLSSLMLYLMALIFWMQYFKMRIL